MTTEIMKVNEIRVNTLKDMIEFLEVEIKTCNSQIVEANKQIANTIEEINEWEVRGLNSDFLKESKSRWEGMKLANEMARDRLQDKMVATKDAIYKLENDWLTVDEEVDEEHEMWLLEQQEGNYKGGTQSWDM